jgi:hypothetical protein
LKDIDTTPKEPRVDDPFERFTSLYDQFYRNVLRYALQHAERDSAEDVASDVFLIAWRRRGAIYQLLAAQPGVINIGTVMVPDGRSGTGLAVSGGAGDFLIIDPGTAQAIAWGTGTVHQGETITAASVSSLEEYETMGWTS